MGGQTEPIIPVQEDGTITSDQQRVIELAHVDGTVNVDASDDHARALAGSFAMQLTPIEYIDGSGVTRCT